ncbi:MAG: membrane protein insertion efficiency factor YidD [Okeania sp. SIO2C2]|uniref:membrane protein insertion efficiency factor YidD n=1 Tax=Okeania sp. SIO2C2 TaxID=2607787 RepID=UPI0013B85649|nr:membrane protein insertion efficiency factor YidD [Okeania sp. SIO2C2]NEP86993.1 membrane protein insertion efficiency factor YidD [Okeania sp. SIO2C2]
MNKIAVALIDGYQQYISPRKGFSCAHRILYNDESCYQYIKRMFMEQDFSGAIQAARQRFKACKEANQTLKLQAVSREKKSKKKQDSKLINCCGDVAEESCECALPDCNNCDFPELDCGSCELDCSPNFDCCGS